MQKFTKFALSLVMALFAIVANAETKSITWDFVGLEQSSGDGEYDGWTYIMNGGATTDYISTGGFHWNGASKASIRNAKYTPATDGKITVYYRSNNATATDRIVALGTSVIAGSDLAELQANEAVLGAGLTNGSEVQSFEADVKANVPVYVYNASGGCTVTKIVYTYEEPAEILVSLLGDGETEYALNGHSVVTIDQPIFAIKVSGLDQVMGDVSYAIYGQNKATLASGVLSVNTVGYAEFAPITLYEGNQYNVVITAGEEVLFEQNVIGAAEPEVREISATIIVGEEQIALNSHSAVSAEMIKSIEVTFDGFVPQQAGYSLNTMKLVEGEESSTWEIDETIAQGALSLNGKGYAELNELITLEAGTKYALIINADGESATFEIMGAYSENTISVSLLGDEETEYVLNGHSIVTIDQPIFAIKVSGLDQVMGEVSYAIYGMNKSTLASGVLSVNTVGYAEFAPITLYEGNQYNVVITAGEEVLFEQNVIGAAEPEVREISATIIAGEDEVTLNSHSAVSAYMIKSIEVTFDGFAPQQAGYSINTMTLVEGEESSSWEIDETIADGTLSINGKGYAELNELITLEAGTKYALIINADGESATFEINGAYFDSEMVVSLLGDEEAEYVLNGHSTVTVDQPISAIKVSGLDQVMDEVSYAIYGMNKNTLASGLLSVNTYGYAEFAPITLYEGNQYNVVITAGEEVIFDQTVIGAAEPEAEEIAATIIAGEDEIALNTHSAVSAEMIKSIEVTFEGFVPTQAGYSLNTMKLVEGEESSTWEIDETIAQGALSLNGKGYAEFDEPITLVAGTKYALIINADSKSATFEIMGAYNENTILVSLLGDEETEYVLNGHSTVTVDQPISAIKVSGLDQVMGEVSYAIYGMNKNTLASGVLSVNTIGFAEFAPITLYEGNQYNVVITAGEEVLFDQTVIGAAEPEAEEISATIIAGEDEVTLNSHSAVSAYMVKSIEVTFDGFVPQQAGYSLSTMKLVEGEESSSWELDETIAQGALSINGKGYAELDELITLNAGTKYALIINADSKSATFEITGAYFDSELVVSLLGDEEAEYTLNGHSTVTVDQPISAIKVSGLDQEMGEVSYAIYGMNKSTLASGLLSVNTIGYAEFAPITLYEGNQYNVVITAGEEVIFDQIVIGAAEPEAEEIAATIFTGMDEIALNTHSAVSADMIMSIEVAFDGFVPTQAGYSLNTMKLVEGEESSSWELDETLAQGALSLNGKGYVELDEPITLVAGTKYALIINADSKSATFEINGSYTEPVIDQLVLINGEEEYALNTHSAVSVEAQTAMTVSFAAAVKAATYTIQPIVGYDEETNAPIMGVPTWGEFSINTTGYAEQNYTYKQGVQYMITIEATLMDDTEASEQFIVNGAYVAEPLTAAISLDGTTLKVTYAIGTDLGDNYAIKPYIMNGETKIEVADYAIDNTTGGFFDPLNLIVIDLNAPLADGQYTLVLPEGMFIVNGGDNNDEWSYNFTVENGVVGINNATVNAANGKMFNLAGQQVNVAKGIVIKNGKKYIVK